MIGQPSITRRLAMCRQSRVGVLSLALTGGWRNWKDQEGATCSQLVELYCIIGGGGGRMGEKALLDILSARGQRTEEKESEVVGYA